MKKFSSFLIVVLLASFTATGQEYMRGDVDGNAQVTIADASVLMDLLLEGNSQISNNADVDLDSAISVADVSLLIDYLLSGIWGDDPVTPPDEHEWVDLGLPSGTQWATCNVGATSPEDFGDYFAWGEIEPKEYYWWNNYKWVDIVENHQLYFTKYNTKSDQGIVDDKIELDPEDDAAYVNWGPMWRMPSKDQIMELIDYCAKEYIERSGVNGELFTGPNGNSIFLPAGGVRLEYDLSYGGTSGFYWGRTICIIGTSTIIPPNASGVQFDSESIYEGGGSRMNGLNERAVRARL